MTKQSLKDDFIKQSWYVWSEGFRYAYRATEDINQAIKEANQLAEAFKKQFEE